MSAAGAVDCVHDGGEVGLVDSGLRIGQHFGDAFAAQKPTEQPCRCTVHHRARLVYETFHVPAERLQLSAPLVRGRAFALSGQFALRCFMAAPFFGPRLGQRCASGDLLSDFRRRVFFL